MDIEIDADLFILEYKLNKYLKENHPGMPSAPLVSLVAKEFATNILKYGGEGFIAVTSDGERLTVTAEDEGVGGKSLSEREGGLGLGLDIARRSCEEFSTEQKPGGGMVVRAVFSASAKSEREGFSLQVGLSSRPHYLESESGDICISKKMGCKYFLFVADVLGHGKRAGLVARKIENYLSDLREVGIERIYRGLEKVLQNTRGCAAFLALVSKDGMEYVNVGNISGWLMAAGSVRRLRNVSGVIGRSPVSQKVFKEAPLPPWFMLIVCTDGIKSQFVPNPEMKWLKALDLQDAAKRIVEEFSVKEDDASVLIARGGRAVWVI